MKGKSYYYMEDKKIISGGLYNKKCEDSGSKVIGIKDNATFLT